MKRTEFELDRPMMVKDGDLEADSRGISGWAEFLKGIMQIATLGILAN